MMHPTLQKEQFSLAYIRAVASTAGFGAGQPTPDDDSVDLVIFSRNKMGAVKSPRLEIQAKCTADVALTDNAFSFPLSLKNFNDLRDPDVLVPRILVVVRVPENPDRWIDCSDEALLLRWCGYWTSLRGMEETENHTSVSISIPRANRFGPEALAHIMDRIGNGETV